MIEKPKLVGGTEDDRKISDTTLESSRNVNILGYAEVPFSERQQILIDAVLHSLPGFLEQYGYQGDFPIERFHLIDKNLLTREDKNKFDGAAVFHTGAHRIYLYKNVEITDKQFIITVCHELLHAVSFQSYTVHSNPEQIDVVHRRMGVEMPVESEGGSLEDYFRKLNEAITDRLMEKFVTYIGANEDSKLSYSVNENLSKVTYVKEKEALDCLYQDLYAKNSDQYASPEAIFNLFVQGMFTGAILPIARLIEKTYGKGYFRKIGEMTK